MQRFHPLCPHPIKTGLLLVLAACSGTALAVDADNDGFPDELEVLEGLSPQRKDNMIFGPGVVNKRWFVQQQFRDLLYREGSPSAVEYWLNQMNGAGLSRTDVILAFMNSGAANTQIKPLGRLLFTYYGTLFVNNSVNGLNYWGGQLSSGAQSLAQISTAFANSAAFSKQYGVLSDAQFVAVLYQNTLGRAPTANEQTAALSLIASQGRGAFGKNMSENVTFVAASANRLWVDLVFAGLGKKVPTATGEQFWIDKMNTAPSTTPAEMVGAYLGTLLPSYAGAAQTYHDRFLAPDLAPPAAPTALSVGAVQAHSVQVNWLASADDSGVSRYELFRDGVKIADVSGLGWTDTGLAASTSYSYTVRAVDAAKQTSALSSPLLVSTSAEGSSITVFYAAQEAGWGSVNMRHNASGSWNAAPGQAMNAACPAYKVLNLSLAGRPALWASFNQNGVQQDTYAQKPGAYYHLTPGTWLVRGHRAYAIRGNPCLGGQDDPWHSDRPSWQLTSTSNAAQSNVPLTVGQVFAPGDWFPNTPLLGRWGDGLPLRVQTDIKALHPDGSVRHAVVTALVPALNPNQSQNLRLQPQAGAPQPEGPVLTAANFLQNTAFDTSINVVQGGVSYSASARDLLQKAVQAGTVNTWLQGPLAGEWLVQAPLRSGGGVAHPHLQAYFHVRAYQGWGSAKVDVVLENNWAYAANPSNQTYDLQVQVGGVAVLNQTGLTHYHHARWKRSFWWGKAPAMQTAPNTAYLLASGSLPHYDPQLVASESALQQQANAWNAQASKLMGIGTVTAYMPGTGGRPDIAPMPAWAALFLSSADTRAWQTTLGNGEQAGSWSIHYRDQNTGRPVTLDSYPYMTVLGNPGDTFNPKTGLREAFPTCTGCTTPYTADSSHQPDLAFLPYLLTGDVYHLEELQFWAGFNMLQANPYYRSYDLGLLKWDSVRGQAWSLRTLAEAAFITPDADPLKAYFSNKLHNNAVYYQNTYVNGSTPSTSTNVLGWIGPLAYDMTDSPWMDDFATWAMGHALDLGFSDWKSILDFKARFPVGRMTDPGYCWIVAGAYHLNVRTASGQPNFTTFGQAYNQYLLDNAYNVSGLSCGSLAYAKALGLTQAGEMMGYATSTQGYPANLQPALAVAAQTDIGNADLAWMMFSTRPVQPDYRTEPQFNVLPRHVPGPVPANNLPSPNPALTSLAANTAKDLGALACTGPAGEDTAWCRAITDYSGFTYAPKTGQMVMFGGGHASTMMDDVLRFDPQSLSWQGTIGSTPCADMTVGNFNTSTGAWNSSGHPASRHTYDLLVVNSKNELVLLAPPGGNGALCAVFNMWNGHGLSHFNLDNGTWLNQALTPTWSGLSSAEIDPVTDWAVVLGPNDIFLYDTINKTLLPSVPHSRTDLSYAKNLVYYPPTDKFYYFVDGNQVFELSLNRNNPASSSVTLLTGVGGPAPTMAETGLAYDPVKQVIGGAIQNGVFYSFNPQTKMWSSQTMQVAAPSANTPASVRFHALAYDSVNQVYIYIDQNFRTWAYRS